MDRRCLPRTALCALLLAAFVHASAGGAFAQGGGGGVSASPSEVDFGGMIRGEPVERSVRVQNGLDHEGRITFEPSGDIAAWVTVEPSDLVLAPHASRVVTLRLHAPSDAPNGAYDGRVAVVVSDAREGAAAPVNVRFGVAIRVDATIGGEEVVRVEAGKLSVDDTEERLPLAGSLWMHNAGNVRVTPQVRLSLMDADGTTQREIDVPQEPLAAGATETRALSIQHGLSPGQYRATVRVLVRDEIVANETVPFDVHPWGELRRKGELAPIFTTSIGNATQKNRMPQGSSVLLVAPFTNTGAVAVEAQFRGRLARDGVVLADLESEALRVDPNERVSFEMLLPRAVDAVGAYIVSGRVHYDGKVTETSEWILNILPAEAFPLERTSVEETSSPPGAQTPGAGVVLVVGVIGLVALAARRRHAP